MPQQTLDGAKLDLANRLFFRLYQCANLLHKTGTRAVAAQGLTTQQWAVLGALSRETAQGGLAVGELARYLMVSRQALAGVLARLARDGHVAIGPDAHDGRSRRVVMTTRGQRLWLERALPQIRDYYDQLVAEFTVNDLAHLLHYLLKMLQQMQRLDAAQGGADDEGPGPAELRAAGTPVRPRGRTTTGSSPRPSAPAARPRRRTAP